MSALCPFRSAGPLPSRLDITGATTVRQPGGVNGSSPSSLNACLELEPAPGPGGGCVVRYVGNGLGYYYRQAASLRADVPIPLDCPLFYWEVEVLDGGEDGSVGMGFAAACVPLSRLPGWDPDSYGYHGDDGKKFASNGRGTPYGPRYGAGDVVGALLDRVRRVVEFFRNGTSLGVAFADVPGTQALYPVVGLRTRGSRVVVNWGPHTQGGRPFKVALRSLELAARKTILEEIADMQLQLYDNKNEKDGKVGANTVTSGGGGAPPPHAFRPGIRISTCSAPYGYGGGGGNGGGQCGKTRGGGGSGGRDGGDGSGGCVDSSDVLLGIVLEHLLREGLAGSAAALAREAGAGAARRVSGRLGEASARQQILSDVRAGRPLAALQRLETRYCCGRSGCLWCSATAPPGAHTPTDPSTTAPTHTHTHTHKCIHAVHNGITGISNAAAQDNDPPNYFVTDNSLTGFATAARDGGGGRYGGASSFRDDVIDPPTAVTAQPTATQGMAMVGGGVPVPSPALVHWWLRLQVFLSLVAGGAAHAALEFAREHLTTVTPPPECTAWGLQRRVLAALQASGEPAPPGLLLGTTLVEEGGSVDVCSGTRSRTDEYGNGLSWQPVTPGSSVVPGTAWPAGRQGWGASAPPSAAVTAVPVTSPAGTDPVAAAAPSYPSPPLPNVQRPSSHHHSLNHKHPPSYGPNPAAHEDSLPAPSTPLPRPQLNTSLTPTVAAGTSTSIVAAASCRTPHRPQAAVTGIHEQPRRSSVGGSDPTLFQPRPPGMAAPDTSPPPSTTTAATAAGPRVPCYECTTGDLGVLSAMRRHHQAHTRLRHEGMWGGQVPGTATAATAPECAGGLMDTTAARGVWGAAAGGWGGYGGEPQSPSEWLDRGTDGSFVAGPSADLSVNVSVPVEELQEALSLLAYTDPRVTGAARLLSAAGREGLAEQVNNLMLAFNNQQQKHQQREDEEDEEKEDEEKDEDEEIGVAQWDDAVVRRCGATAASLAAGWRSEGARWAEYATGGGARDGHLGGRWPCKGEEPLQGTGAYADTGASGGRQQLSSLGSGSGVKHSGAGGGGDGVTVQGPPRVYGMAAERSPLERLYRQCTAVWDELIAAVDCPAAQLVDWRQELLAVRQAMQ